MYSRSKDRPKSPIRLPDHYSGWAFRDLPPEEERDTTLPHSAPPEAIQATGSASNDPDPLPQSCPLVSEAPPASKEEKASPHTPPAPFEKLFGNLGTSLPFSHGLGFDELLILGLMLLLAQNDHDPEILPLLALLLFCG